MDIIFLKIILIIDLESMIEYFKIKLFMGFFLWIIIIFKVIDFMLVLE